ncbi:MAG: hypothetical protein GF404_03905 [candidate division Zixibacteria bacterium]|nr:hypothetical protein [candidate division Zixibacteria bacterium]
MPFSNINNLRLHLSEFARSLGKIENLPLNFDGATSIKLPHRSLKSDSEKVKGRESNAPSYEKVNLSADWVSLMQSSLVPHSVVVARDESLTVIYRENVDYSIDYSDGLIRYLADGQINDGQQVSVWYYHYRIYQRGADYQISYSSGTVSLMPDGALESSQAVLIDYEIESASVSDGSLAQALEEAHVTMLGMIDEEHHTSGDRQLEVAETCLALEVVARMKAQEVLQSGALSTSGKTYLGREYLNLGESYRRQAQALLVNYRPSQRSLANPLKIRSNH